jgi:hypothetical protein
MLFEMNNRWEVALPQLKVKALMPFWPQTLDFVHSPEEAARCQFPDGFR